MADVHMNEANASNMTIESPATGSSNVAGKSSTILPGTGNRDTCPDTIITNTDNITIRRPFDKMSDYTLVYRKNHSCISFGVAWKIIKHIDDKYLLTTPFMSLPVDRPFFYMSPSEFEVLPRAAYIKEVKCKVIMRSPRKAIETNSPISTLVTINDHMLIGHKEGLNLCTRSIDKRLEYTSSPNTMIPNGTKNLTIDEDEEIVKCMYGSICIKTDETEKPMSIDKQDIGDLDDSRDPYGFAGFDYVPRSFLNLGFVCNRYLTLTYDGAENKADIGFPQMNTLLDTGVAKYFVDQTVVEYSYVPNVGYVTQPPEMRTNGYWGNVANGLDIINMNGNILSRRMTLNTKNGTVSASPINLIDVEDDHWKNLCKRYRKNMYCCPIEKSQYISMGLSNNSNGQVQPSLHVGLYPVPRITTTDGDIPKRFSDVAVQWDIQTECVIGFGYSNMDLTHFPHANIVNVENGLYMANHEESSENLYFQTEYSTIHNAHIARFQ